MFVRAPHAHATIVSIDTAAARAHPGVLAVLTGDDYVADGHIGMAHFPNPADARRHQHSELRAQAGAQNP